MVEPQKYSEKRRSPRIDRSIPVKISSPAADLVTETRNISASGAYCRVSDYIEPMTRVSLTFLLPVKTGGKVSSRKIQCGGVVVRTENIPFENGFNVAIFFNDVRPQDSKALVEMVHASLTDGK